MYLNDHSQVSAHVGASPFSSPFLTRPEGLEPPTSGLEIHCSVQLSYGRKSFIHNTLQTTKHRCRNRSWRLSSQLSFGGSIAEIARCIVENARRPADFRSAARTLRARRRAVHCSDGPIVRLARFHQRRTSFSRTRRLDAAAYCGKRPSNSAIAARAPKQSEKS